MVALTIVALSLTAVTASISQMIDAAEAMRNRTYASWIAQNRITELRLAVDSPEVGTSNGEVQYANTDWSSDFPRADTVKVTSGGPGGSALVKIRSDSNLSGSGNFDSSCIVPNPT